MITFSVPGVPVPQGSMSVFNGHVVHKSGSTLTKWRDRVARAAEQGGCEKMFGPITVEVLFLLPRPKTVKRFLPHVRPDIDKYARATLDALTGVAFHDDGQVVDLIVRKRYAHHGPAVGTYVRVDRAVEARIADAA